MSSTIFDIVTIKINCNIMKNASVLLVILSMIILSSCDKIDELTKFDVDYSTSYTVSSTTIIDTPISLFTPDITTNSTTTFENNNTRADLIESIKLRKVRLTLTSPNDGDFDFLKEIRVFIDATDLEEEEIAYEENLEDNGSMVLNLILTNVELKEFVKKDSFKLRVQTTTDQTITQDHVIDIDCTFRVDAKILGV